MAQHDYNLINQSGANFRADLNNALSAIATNNAGTSAPSTTFQYEWWIDEAAGVLKIRNSANSAWITTGLNLTTNNSFTGDITGNAATSTILATSRTINGVAFNGSANISFNTDSVAEGSSNLYYTDARFDTRLASKSTTNITEGSNLYFTNERVDDRVDDLLVAGSGISLTYDDGSNTLTIANTNDADITSVVAGNGLTGGGTSGDVTLNVAVDDSSLEINADALRVKASGITNTMLAGSIANSKLANSSVTINSQSLALGGSLDLDTSEIPENTNLYYTDARFDTRLASKDTDNLTEGDNLYYTQARFDTAFGNKSTANLSESGNLYFTDARARAAISEDSAQLSYNSTTGVLSYTQGDTDTVSEGSNNLYYTSARANADFDTRLATKSTSNLAEGTNLYYTSSRFDSAFTSKDTDDLSEGTTNLYYTQSRFDSTFGNKTTANLTENTNLYYTDTRANAAIDARVVKSFVDALGIQAASVADNSVVLGNDTTGNYIQTITGTSNKITVSGSGSESADVTLTLPDDVQIADSLTVAGNLTVNGTLVSLDTTNLDIEDNLFQLNAGLTGSPVNDSGMLINRGSANNSIFMWDESVDKFTLGLTTADGSATGNITLSALGTLVANIEGAVTGNVTGQVSDISNFTTANLTENTNLYYTQARFDSALAAKSTTNLSEGSNLYYTDARFDTRLASKDTDDVSEGTSNLYYTSTRFNSAFSSKSTSDLSEGTNLYYTDARVQAVSINNVVEDTTPQLGGDLDLNSSDITGTGDINITGTIQSSGNITGTLATAAQTNITSLGTLTDLTVDDITINGSTISDAGTLTLDAAGEIHLDADAEIIRIRHDGGDIGMVQMTNNDLILRSMVSDKDIIFKGNDGGSTITALTLDMSAEGDAFFNHFVTANRFYVPDNGLFIAGNGSDLKISCDGTHGLIESVTGDLTLDVVGEINLDTDGAVVNFKDGGTTFGLVTQSSNNFVLRNPTSDKDILFKGNDNGSVITALTLDMSDAGAATFNSNISTTGEIIGGLYKVGSTTVIDGSRNLTNIGTIGSGAITQTVASDGGDYLNINHTGNESWSWGARSGSGADDYLDVGIAGGTRVMSWHEDGKCGIGTTSPAQKLHVNGALQLENNLILNENTPAIISNSGDLRTFVGGSERLRIDSSGRLLIGTTSAGGSDTTKLHIMSATTSSPTVANDADEFIIEGSGHSGMTFLSTSSSNIRFGDAADSSVGIISYSHSANSLSFGTNNVSSRMTIDSSGSLLVGTTSSYADSYHTIARNVNDDSNDAVLNVVNLDTTEAAQNTVLAVTANDAVFSGVRAIDFRTAGGTIASITMGNSGVAYNTSSDYRLKENVDYDFTALDRVAQLKPARFNFISDANNTVDGFLAHEVSDIVPEAIHGEKDGEEMQGIDQSKLVPLLTKAIQEQQDQIDKLSKEIAKLKKK